MPSAHTGWLAGLALAVLCDTGVEMRLCLSGRAGAASPLQRGRSRYGNARASDPLAMSVETQVQAGAHVLQACNTRAPSRPVRACFTLETETYLCPRTGAAMLVRKTERAPQHKRADRGGERHAHSSAQCDKKSIKGCFTTHAEQRMPGAAVSAARMARYMNERTVCRMSAATEALYRKGGMLQPAVAFSSGLAQCQENDGIKVSVLRESGAPPRKDTG